MSGLGGKTILGHGEIYSDILAGAMAVIVGRR